MVCLVPIFVALVTLPGVLHAQKAIPKAELKPETSKAYEGYVRQREAAILKQRIQGGKFLWTDEDAGRRERVRGGEVVIEPGRDRGTVEVRGGMIHDWIGAAFLPKTTLPKLLASIQNYNNHKNLFQPEVVDSRVTSQSGNQYKVRLRLLKRKVITVVLNTDHEITYFPLDAARQHSRSRTTRVAEVEDPGENGEHELTPGDDHGFLWNLDTFWRFLERDGGVWVECEALSLSRGIPMGLGWLVTPIVRELPRESLTQTLEGTRRAAR